MKTFHIFHASAFFLTTLVLFASASSALAEPDPPFLLLGAIASVPSVPKPVNQTEFIVYDGHVYQSGEHTFERLDEASHNPEKVALPKLLTNGSYQITCSRDGHYYIPGFVNGFPIRFLVDSGSTYSSIPSRLADVTGLHIGTAIFLESAQGKVKAGLTRGNEITLGSFAIKNQHVVVLDSSVTAIVGSEVLNQLDISYVNGVMLIKPPTRLAQNFK